MRLKLVSRARRLVNILTSSPTVGSRGGLDREWYLQMYRDVAAAGVDPSEHYERHGQAEGRFPSPAAFQATIASSFDARRYLDCNPDVEAAGVDPLAHYARYGHIEGRAGGPLNIPPPRPDSLPHTPSLTDDPPFASPTEDEAPLADGPAADSDHPRVEEDSPDAYTSLYALIVQSGEFDTNWYIEKYASDDADEATFIRADPIAHYLLYGAEANFDPTPWFSTSQYLQLHADVRAAKVNPFAHYLAHGRAEGRRLHTLATQSELWSKAREAWLEEHALEDLLVSVIMPTKDREQIIPKAIESVLAQTWSNWELLIVDDGSADGTAALLEGYRDPRIRYFVNDGSPGVSGARNAGLRRAKGDIVAYLDSDNEWVPEYLRYMVSELQISGAESAYSILAVQHPDGSLTYLAHPYDRNELLIENYIDLNTFVHLATAWEREGGFDESLRRMVDWDLIIRYTVDSPPSFASFVGVFYNASHQLPRITNTENSAYLYVIRNKHLIDWKRVDDDVNARRAELVSIIMCVDGRAQTTERCLSSLFSKEAGAEFELILVDNASDAPTREVLSKWAEENPATIRLITNPRNYDVALGNNIGFAASSGATVVFLSNDSEVSDGWLAALIRPLKDETTKGTQPRLVYDDGRIQCVGLAFNEKSLFPYAIYDGAPGNFEPTMQARRYSALTAACLAVRAADFAPLRGFDPIFVDRLEDVDFCLRLGEGKDVFQYVPDSLVVRAGDRSHGQWWSTRQSRKTFVERWGAAEIITPNDKKLYKLDGIGNLSYTPDLPDWIDGALATWRPSYSTEVTRIPFIARRARHELAGRTIAIKMPCPMRSMKEHWGDYHFAVSLETALLRAGVRARVDFLNEWYDRSTPGDINLVLRGLSRFTPQQGTLNLMWHLSHPLKVDVEEFSGFDHVLVASDEWAKHLASRIRAPVHALAQCTDASRFMPSRFNPAIRHGLLYVANSRKQERAVVLAAKAADAPISIYGEMWDGLAPPDWVKGNLVPNHELPAWYAGAEVVLNDHWSDMREHGFVSNRIFDALACGAPVVSDTISGLPAGLESGVFCFSDATSFKAAVEQARSEPESRSPELLDLARYVRAHHSFDARANSILRIICGLLP